MDEAFAKQYPEHARLSAPLPEPVTKTNELSQQFGEFLDWLKTHGYELCEWSSGDYYPTHKSARMILAERFGVDEQALDNEKKHMIAQVRAAHAAAMARVVQRDPPEDDGAER